MDQKSGMHLLSKRNILGAVLVAGIATGIYLGDYWKGLGGGGGLGIGGSPDKGTTNTGTDSTSNSKPEVNVSAPEEDPEKPVPTATPRQVLKVLIADRAYFLRSPEGDEPIELKELVAQAKAASGDEDGIRVRVYRKPTSRAGTEVELQNALLEAGIKEDQTAWVVSPIDD